MSDIETFARKEKKREAELNGDSIKPEKKQPTTQEILADKANSELFGLYLQEEGKEELGHKIRGGDLGREDYAELSKVREGFLEVLENSKNTLEALSPPALKEIIEKSPELKQLADHLGPSEMKAAVARYLPRMAVLDRERFARVSKSALAIAEVRKAIAEEDKEIAKVRRDYGLSKEEYSELLLSDDPKEFEKLIKKDLTFFQKIFMRGNDLRKEINNLDRADVIRERLEELHDAYRQAGAALELTLMDNEILRASFNSQVFKEGAPVLEPGESFSEAKNLKPDLDEKNVKDAWREYCENSKKEFGYDPDEVVDWQRQSDIAEFTEKYVSKGKPNKKGFWGTIWSAGWESIVEDLINKKITS